MPQLHCYVPDPTAALVQKKAQAAGLSVSRYISELIKRDIGSEWPKNFFTEVVGGWQGELLQRPDQGQFEQRDELLLES